MSDFTDSCRMCAIKTKNLRNLYQVDDEHGKTLAQKIKECLSLSFYEFELRPKCICTKCVTKLNSVYEFYQLIRSSDEIFKKIVATEFITKPEIVTVDDEVKDLKPLKLISAHSDVKVKPIKINVPKTKQKVETNVEQSHNQPHVFVNDINPDLERLWRQKLGLQSTGEKYRKVQRKPAAIVKRQRRSNSFKEKLQNADFQCFDCKYIFPTMGKLQTHMRELHETTIECRICMRNFTRHVYSQHLCDGGTEMQCQYCEEKFNSTAMLVKHINQQHKNHHNYKCYDCARAFPTKALLEIHKPTHDTEEKRFVCDICDDRFPTRYKIKEHIETTHTDKRSFLCATCGKNFNNVTNWRLHVNRHTPTKPVACPQCPKRFFDKHGLKKHEEIHAEQQFICDICGSVMRSKASYSEHMSKSNCIAIKKP